MKLDTRKRTGLAVGVFLVIVGVIVILQVTSPDRGEERAFDPVLDDLGAVVGQPAPELVGLRSWINSEPRTIGALRGRVVLVDFWTYTCVNCIRTLPYLRDWHQKYADDGLTIVGVHTPEFGFERELSNVEGAVEKYQIDYAVALDNDRSTWHHYRNQYWPRKYLIDRNGVVRYDHIGEGAYEATEGWIQRLLAETGADIDEVVKVEDPASGAAGLFRLVTPELYAGVRGFASGHIGNVEEYLETVEAGEDGGRRLVPRPVTYRFPESPAEHKIYLEGLWEAGEESIRHARTTEAFEGAVLLRYRAASVNLVIRPAGADPFDIEIRLDGEPIQDVLKGQDVEVRDDGRTYVIVDSPRMYNLVNSPEFGDHDLTILAGSDAFEFYAFTFGVVPES